MLIMSIVLGPELEHVQRNTCRFQRTEVVRMQWGNHNMLSYSGPCVLNIKAVVKYFFPPKGPSI